MTTPAPATPEQALASAQAAVAQAGTSGRLDPGAGNDLSHRLDDLAKALAGGKSKDISHKVDDLLRRVSDLSRGGQLSGSAFTRLNESLNRLAALVPSSPERGKPSKH